MGVEKTITMILSVGGWRPREEESCCNAME